MLTEKLVNGKDAVDMISEFWEKLAYIEYNYAKRYLSIYCDMIGIFRKFLF